MDNTQESAIRVRNVSKTFRLPHEKHTSLKSLLLSGLKRKNYELQQALTDINFEIRKGEFFGIVGRNGSGKSTLLKCIAGVYVPNKGKIHIHGKLVPFIELGVGFNPELSGRDNVYLNGALLGFSRAQMDAMYDEIVEFSELDKFMDQKLKNYSSGMQVRLAFSIAIKAKGDILLLDEVLAVGDSSFQRKCLDYFKEIKRTGKTVILVSHSMATIQEFCDRALMLQDSKIVAIGDPIKIAAQYELANSVYATSSLSSNGNDKAKKIRPHNPDIKIINVRVRSKKDITTEFGLKDEVIVEVEVEVKKKRDFVLSINLLNTDGELLAGLRSKADISKLPNTLGRHSVICKIKAGQFPNGPYHLIINAITDSNNPEIIDVASHDFGVKLPVITFIETEPYKKGKFYMDAKWQVKSAVSNQKV